MRHITIILLLLTLTLPAVAQQWESFAAPTEPGVYVKKLSNLQNNVFLSHVDGVYRSPDGGDHWQKVYHHIPNDVQDPLLLEVNRSKNRLYFARAIDTSGFYGLYSSENFGDSWSYIGSSSLYRLAFIGDTLYSIWNYQSPQNFLSRKLNSNVWQPITSFPHDTAGIIRTYVGQGEHLWVISGKGLYHSPDAGYHWELNRPLANLPPITGWPDKIIYIEALNDEIVILNEHAGILYYSKDHGANWEETPSTSRTLFNSGEHLYCMDTSGTQLLRFGGGSASNWTSTPIGCPRNIIMDGVGEYEGTEWMLSHHFGVLRKRPNDPGWQVSNGDLSPSSGGDFYYWDNHLFNSTRAQSFSADNGVTWKQNLYPFPSAAWRNGNYSYRLNEGQTSILRCLNSQRFEWTHYVNLPGRVSTIAAFGDTLLALSSPPPAATNYFRSLDNGLTWETIPAQFDIPFVSNKGKFFLIREKSLHRSDDLGATWPAVHTFPISGTLASMHIIHDTIFIAYQPDDLIYYSIDEGQSFDTLAAPQNPNTTPFRMRGFGELLVLCMDDGLAYISRDAGKTWTSMDCEVGQIFWDHIAYSRFVYGDNTLFLHGLRLRLDDQRQASGKVFLDLNGNGQKDLNEKGLNDLLVKNAQQQALTVSYKDGDFSTLLGPDAEALSIANVPTHYTVSPATVPVPAGSAILPPILFAIKPQGAIEDMAVNMTVASAFRSGYSNTLYVNAKNVGTVPKSGQLKLTLNPLLSAASVTPAASLVVGDTLIWNYTNLGLLSEFKVKLDFTTAIVSPGTPVSVRAVVSGGLDINLANNTAFIVGQIVSSYDPNDKAVSETHVPINEVDGEELVYTVRFQNLGNIATDFITVRDTLSESIDANSVRVLASSHPYELKIEDGHILVFRFNPIRLTPASEDTIGSQGFVQFAARLKPGLEIGDEIANTAHIYFDFNPAVVTNTVSTQISVVSTFEPSQQTQAMEIFPNPASGQVTLRLPESMDGHGRIEIFSVEGKLVHAIIAQGNVQEIELPGNITVGTYWCRWLAEGKVYWGKLVVVR